MCSNESCSPLFYSSVVLPRDEILEFMYSHGTLPRTKMCRCGRKLMKLYEPTLVFRCNKKVVKKPKTKAVLCNSSVSLKINTFFGGVHSDVVSIYRFVAVLLHINPPRYRLLKEELHISRKTMVDWHAYCREVFIYHSTKVSEKIGGPGKVIEVYRAKFGRSKYNRDRRYKRQWVLGGIERGSEKSFFLLAGDRSTTSLLEMIRQWVIPGTTIISDCCKAYSNSKKDLQQFYDNHSISFVDLETQVHLNTIEPAWCEVLACIRKYGIKEALFAGFLAEFQFKRRYPTDKRLHHFFMTAAELYPPPE